MHLVDDALDVLDSLLDGIQRLLEYVPSNVAGEKRIGRRRWRCVRGGGGGIKTRKREGRRREKS
jgi:hypothetical protein